MHANEGGLVGAGESDTGGAVGFVADDEVEGRATLLGLRYHVTFSGEAPPESLYRLGGRWRLAGFQSNELTGQDYALGFVGYTYELGRVLARSPRLLLLYDATRGVDVGTKAEIYRLMREQAQAGVGVLFYSSDAAELANLADRVLVLHDGVVRAELTGEITEEEIVAAAVGGRGKEAHA